MPVAMSHPKTNNIRKFFVYDLSTNSSFCQIDNCGASLRGDHASNLERHVKRRHDESYKTYCEEKTLSKKSREDRDDQSHTHQMTLDQGFFKSVRVRVDLPTLKEACLELVIVNGRPFKMIDDSGFRKLLDPMLEALSGHNKKACVNAENIREKVTLRASRIRKEIQQELGASFFSLKVDVATRLDRALLGVNAQFVSEGKVMLRTLAMKELTNRHIAEYIKSTLVEILEQYDIDLCQIYTITTDNGANMVKSVKLMSAEQGHCTASMDQEAPSTSCEVTGTSRTRYELSEPFRV